MPKAEVRSISKNLKARIRNAWGLDAKIQPGPEPGLVSACSRKALCQLASNCLRSVGCRVAGRGPVPGHAKDRPNTNTQRGSSITRLIRDKPTHDEYTCEGREVTAVIFGLNSKLNASKPTATSRQPIGRNLA